jgi:hypothetical protein
VCELMNLLMQETMDDPTVHVTELLSAYCDRLSCSCGVTCRTHKVVSDTKVTNIQLPINLSSHRFVPDSFSPNRANQTATW